MHPKKYKDMMSWLTRNKSTNMKDHVVDTLNKYEDTPNVKAKPDILRNMLIEDMKSRDLDSDEIRYLMDTKDRSAVPKATPKQTALVKNKVVAKPFKKMAKTLKFDPTPTVLTPTMIFDPLAEEQQQKFNNLLKEVEAEKTKNRTEGLAGLLGGKKAYV